MCTYRACLQIQYSSLTQSSEVKNSSPPSVCRTRCFASWKCFPCCQTQRWINAGLQCCRFYRLTLLPDSSLLFWYWCHFSQKSFARGRRECKLINASLERPASRRSLQGNHFPLRAGVLWLIAHKSLQFMCRISVSIVLSGRCDSAELCQQPNSQTWRHSNQSIIKLLITDCWAVSNIKETPRCFSAPWLKILGSGGRQVCLEENVWTFVCVRITPHACTCSRRGIGKGKACAQSPQHLTIRRRTITSG